MYSEIPLMRSPMGQKKLPVLMDFCINEGFLKENVKPFCQAGKKSGRSNEVTILMR